MQQPIKPKFSITGIFVQDPEDHGYTGFFSEIPEAVAEGDNVEEVIGNLLNILPVVLDVKKQIIEDEYGSNTFKKTFEFELT